MQQIRKRGPPVALLTVGLVAMLLLGMAVSAQAIPCWMSDPTCLIPPDDPGIPPGPPVYQQVPVPNVPGFTESAQRDVPEACVRVGGVCVVGVHGTNSDNSTTLSVSATTASVDAGALTITVCNNDPTNCNGARYVHADQGPGSFTLPSASAHVGSVCVTLQGNDVRCTPSI